MELYPNKDDRDEEYIFISALRKGSIVFCEVSDTAGGKSEWGDKRRKIKWPGQTL